MDEEYELYLKLKGVDRFELQKKVLLLNGYDQGEIEIILSNSPSNILSNSALLDHLKKGIDKAKDWFAERQMVLRTINEKFTLTSGFERPVCSNCNNEIMGVVVFKRYRKDFSLLDHINSVCLCVECRTTEK